MNPKILHFQQVPKLRQCWYTSSLLLVANGLQVFVVTLAPTGQCLCQLGWLTYWDHSPYSDDNKQEAAPCPAQSHGLREIDSARPPACSYWPVSSLSQARWFMDGHLAQAKQNFILFHGSSPRGSSFFPWLRTERMQLLQLLPSMREEFKAANSKPSSTEGKNEGRQRTPRSLGKMAGLSLAWNPHPGYRSTKAIQSSYCLKPSWVGLYVS